MLNRRYFILFVAPFLFLSAHGATIDSLNFAEYSGGSYSPVDKQFKIPAPAGTYFLSDGTAWQTGAGIFYTPTATYESTVVSNGYVYYHFSPLDIGVLYQQKDASDQNFSQGTLGWINDVVLFAAIGSQEATFSGYATILANSPPDNLDPHYNFDYFSASVGESVYFDFSFSIWNPGNMTWQPDTFENSFDYTSGGIIDFTQVAPEPKTSTLALIGAAMVATKVYQKKRKEFKGRQIIEGHE